MGDCRVCDLTFCRRLGACIQYDDMPAFDPPSSAPEETGKKKPCGTCPWRVDRRASDIPNFSLELAEKLRNTSPDERNIGPDFGAPQFACHQSEVGHEVVCRGWLAMVGNAHPGVRLQVFRRQLSAEVLYPDEDWPELHESYPEVLEKLKRTL